MRNKIQNQRILARLNSKCILENAAKITGFRASPSMLVYCPAMALYHYQKRNWQFYEPQIVTSESK
jgi:hypothetical protein